MKVYPKVFIIVLNFNGKEVIKKCLSSLFKLDYPNFEVILVDNNSQDGSLEIAKSNFSKANFIKNSQNRGFSAGNNVGIKFALERMADYILIINSDTESEKDFLTKLVLAAEKDSEAGILSPVIFGADMNKIWFSGGKIDWFRMKGIMEQDAKSEESYETEYLSGCAMLVKAEVFQKIGLFDEDFFLYYEDTDFSFRAKRAGYKNLVVSSSWIYHFEKSEESKTNKLYWLIISGLIFFQKNTPSIFRPWIRAYFMGRKIKNGWDMSFNKNKSAEIVRKAYKDFKNVKI
jgi:GT2 family glycosyltransferase